MFDTLLLLNGCTAENHVAESTVVLSVSASVTLSVRFLPPSLPEASEPTGLSDRSSETTGVFALAFWGGHTLALASHAFAN